jgi:competence protein ComEA
MKAGWRVWLWLWLWASIGLVAGGPALAAVDANTASRDQLERIAGIGPALAQRIVAERRQGAFRDLDDLAARVRGIGEASLRRLVRGGLVVGDDRARDGGARDDRARDDRARHRRDVALDRDRNSATPPAADRRNVDGRAADGARPRIDVHVGLRGDARPR